MRGLSDIDIQEHFSKYYGLNAPALSDLKMLRNELNISPDMAKLIESNSKNRHVKPNDKILDGINITHEHDYVQWLVCGKPESLDFIKTEKIFHQLGLRRLVECELLRGKPMADITRYVNLFVDNIGFKITSKQLRRYAYVYWHIYTNAQYIYGSSTPRVDYDGLESYMIMDVLNTKYSVHRQYLYGDKEVCDGLQGLPILAESLSAKITATLGMSILRKCESGMTGKLTKPEVQLFTTMRQQADANKDARDRDDRVKGIIEDMLERVNNAAGKRERESRESFASGGKEIVDTSKPGED